jgi:D-amino-acid oxidase
MLIGPFSNRYRVGMASMGDTDVLVVGAGVSGLTTALLMVQHGLRVRVVSHKMPIDTTSAVAGAIWGPYLAKDPRVMPWSFDTLNHFHTLAGVSTSGVRMTPGVEAAVEEVSPPHWMTRLPGFQPCDPATLPAGYRTGWRYTVPIVRMADHLQYLQDELSAHAVRIEPLAQPLTSLDDVGPARVAVINCSGLGARELVADYDVTPIWGQLVVVDNPGLTEFFADHGESPEPTYFMPQGDQVVLGGVIAPGDGPTQPDAAVGRAIVARCAAVEPRLAGARIRSQRVGLRPARPDVRLERQDRPGRVPVIHNYGHGGSGVTLAWGCAQDVLELVRSC